ncbi:hypothetical protein V2A60_004847 [Cordyceps javanica]|uniref:5-hydroxyisourate hydrolase n=1 Tax=Cordyceps javanica TaxID=43265 RepID=A0A545WAD4_9HYPO|nr:hydroxyisourate hydrolase [Cordyceps javanica]TQW10951.1 hydroxyisourate hydrolase [Cordyceps javanica]
MATESDLITCHVLDTTAGRPATNITVRLQGAETKGQPNSGAHTYTSVTDADGRIKLWEPAPGETSSLAETLKAIEGRSQWRLTFDTESYFGEGNTFFPEAVVVFRVDPGQHYHVPLLLSPFTYTTYRGS